MESKIRGRFKIRWKPALPQAIASRVANNYYGKMMDFLKFLVI